MKAVTSFCPLPPVEVEEIEVQAGWFEAYAEQYRQRLQSAEHDGAGPSTRPEPGPLN